MKRFIQKAIVVLPLSVLFVSPLEAAVKVQAMNDGAAGADS